MRALVLEDEGARLHPDYPRPVVPPGEALIRVLLAGICATDLELIKGYAAFRGVLGHEFVGRVESCDDEGWTGRRVVGTINLGCGSCAVCGEEGAEHCPERTVLGISERDGAFADYLSLPVANLLPVPEGLADEDAVFTEPLAAALRIPEQVEVPPSGRVAVVGPGRLGQPQERERQEREHQGGKSSHAIRIAVPAAPTRATMCPPERRTCQGWSGFGRRRRSRLSSPASRWRSSARRAARSSAKPRSRSSTATGSSC